MPDTWLPFSIDATTLKPPDIPDGEVPLPSPHFPEEETEAQNMAKTAQGPTGGLRGIGGRGCLARVQQGVAQALDG